MSTSGKTFADSQELATEPPREESLRELFQAVESLPKDQTAALWEACDICPDIVDSESDGILFLSNEKCNYWKAAEKIAQYWKERRALFGERAHLPLTQTGRGALTEDDALSVQSGIFAILPKTCEGQSVLLVDRGRSLMQASDESKLRAAFYILNILSHEKDAQTRGMIALSMLVTPRVTGLDHGFVTRIMKIVALFPMKIHLHLLNSSPKTQTTRSIIAHRVLTAGMAFASLYFGRFEIITETTGHDILCKLKSLGMSALGVPTALGGTWTYENFNKWCRERIGREQLRDPSSLPALAATSIANNVSTSTAGIVNAGHQYEDLLHQNEKKRDRTRRLNVIHSRQKRERRKMEHAQLRSQYEALFKRQRVLQARNRELELLLSKAQTLVREHDIVNLHPLHDAPRRFYLS